MDLDFSDPRGAAVLPVESQITLIDARPDHCDPRPVSNLEITQILDDRESAVGALTLEIKAVGKGLVPELAELVQTNFTGLMVEEIVDQGLAIARIDTEGDNVACQSERNWLLKLRVPDNAPASIAFHFPEASRNDVTVHYRRYADADLAEVEPELALAGLSLRPRPFWQWLVAAAAILAACAAGWWWTRKHTPALQSVIDTYQLPAHVTPFSVLGLLQRMASDRSLRWSDPDRAELQNTLDGLERQFFDRVPDQPELDLGRIGRDWINRANHGHG
jgi:hypothetical protein